MISITYQDIAKILKGIDLTETKDEDGWWETNKGADFGRERLNEIKTLFEKERENDQT